MITELTFAKASMGDAEPINPLIIQAYRGQKGLHRSLTQFKR